MSALNGSSETEIYEKLDKRFKNNQFGTIIARLEYFVYCRRKFQVFDCLEKYAPKKVFHSDLMISEI